jgi:hypothetical protein
MMLARPGRAAENDLVMSPAALPGDCEEDNQRNGHYAVDY